MKPLLVQCVFWGLLFILQWGGHECCLREERMALLQIKAFFTTGIVNVVVAHRFLPSWLEKGDNDCCTWERVTCNPITGRVTELSLDHLSQNYCNSFSGLSLDVSLFSPFEELLNLHLSGNCFSCCLHNQGFDKLKRVEDLNLAENYFGDNIFRSLGALTTLTSLNLSWNWIYGRRGGLQDLTMLKNLKVLDLSANYVERSIPPAIGNLTTMVALSLAENHLIGTLPNQEFCKLKNLEELDLSHNYGLEGVLPPCFTNLTSLRLVDLSTNKFKGEISFIFPNLKYLEYIRLGDNHFKGKFSFSLLANHSKVKLVEILNNDNLEVETEDSNWVPEFQLEVLVLSRCNLNKQSLKVPTFLAYQSRLKLLDLSHNNLRGGFPDCVIKNNSQLEVLKLSNNSLEGQLHLQHLNTSILWMDVSENQLRGRLEENLGRKLPYMTTLNLSMNHFVGFVPSSFCNMSGLVQLDLSNNFFDGEIAKEMVSGCLNSLRVLILSGNRFHGQIFSTDFNMTTLSVLHLEDNQFSGTITNAISTSYLELLDASNNHFSGEVHWISNMTHLITLLIQNNSLTGRFPCKIPALNHLDVSHNSLSGALLPCKYEINHLLLHSNKFTGPIPETLLHWPLLTLNIRDNNLSGNIPSVTRAESLRVLLLGGNQLNGSFPNQLCSLQKISLLDLSHNNFFGEIPQCISNITFGKTRYADFNHDDVSVFIGSKVVTLFGNFLVKQYEIVPRLVEYYEKVTIDFVVKKRSNSYKGDILNCMSGLDLSCNSFTGEIPHELGELGLIHTLNLSRNQIKGPIPASLSGLRQLESLDLSYNNLTGKIPPELIDLNFLAFFSVAYNNLSGRVPDMKGQFGTFDESSYEGNLYLCGELLANKCNNIIEPIPPTPPSELTSEAKWYEIDMLIFWVAFIVAFIIFFLGVVISLYVNPYWSRRLWNFVDDCYYACYFKFCM
ncbi:PREDICTED: probable LRR receptor-like serine/threonine-protein kinase At4g36180 [Ipomoea nil]|uniref:probable LRR receptor-like serine/threonine-protein kinase At4g36180 n=1 Tax=Ipomoea nil TaxID=35883 RepID=UPI0009016D17|nr:PREDICTED: probable LRR receptor-like serine/threonine-protein kinase At4g36180 [Ipomoea nil]